MARPRHGRLRVVRRLDSRPRRDDRHPAARRAGTPRPDLARGALRHRRPSTSGWPLEAAEVVCAGDAVPSEDVLGALLQLIRKSLVLRVDVRHGHVRYGLLETLREF